MSASSPFRAAATAPAATPVSAPPGPAPAAGGTAGDSGGAGPASQPNHREGLVLAVIVAAQMMVGLDATIINVALPHIQSALRFSPTGLAWVFNLYTLVYGGLLLLGGRAGDLFGRRRLFMAGVLVFTVASLLGGLAPTGSLLLAARALQGAGGAMATPNVVALIAVNFPEGQARTRALALFSSATSASLSVGMVLGGVLTAWASWRWVFFVNVPFGAAVLWLAPRVVRETEGHSGRLDLSGAAASVAGVAGVVYGFLRAAGSGWGDHLAQGSLAAGAAVLALFVLIERRAESPVMPLELLADRTRAAAYGAFFLIPAGMFGVFYFLGQYFQDVAGYSALRSGFAFLPMTVAMFALIRAVPKLLPRLGARVLLSAGMLLCLSGMLWLTALSPGRGYLAEVFGPMLMIGVGMGISTVPLAVTVLSGVRPQEAGAASGMMQTMQWGGSAVGLSVLVAVFGSTSRAEAARPGASAADAFTHGATAGFGVGAVFVFCALVLGAVALGRSRPADGGPPAPIPAQAFGD
jgi:EmrB/QacA subfamily drug resistance transporter